MNGKDLKITTKLIISAASFLLPLGIMLFLITSVSLGEIRRDRNELHGIAVLRPAVSLMQLVSQYIRLSLDNAPGDLEVTGQHISDSLLEMKDKYEAYFGGEAVGVSMQSFFENWGHISETRVRVTVLWAYRQFIQDLCNLINYTGDISGLVTDSGLENVYLVEAAVHELPQAQERMVLIGSLIRTVEEGAFTERRRAELERHLELLVHSDNIRIQNRLNAAERLEMQKTRTETYRRFEIHLKTCYERIALFSEAIGMAINRPVMEAQYIFVINEAADHANNAAYQLQIASLDRLETLILGRIHTYQQRFSWLLACVAAATILAFTIIFVTTVSIRKSTNTMGRVFKRLDANDLSVHIQVLSQDELGEFMTALGGFLEKLKKAFSLFRRNVSMVSTAVNELSSSANNITTTANEQSAGIAEIVTTMENNKNISAQTVEKTVEVAELAVQTRKLSKYGADLRDANENMMLEIRNQNAKIISIINNLADILSHIDESIQLIDTIADHTKLIAFNAALEASSSGEAGIRFAVVAGEMRRFADSVVESVIEIKERIAELQNASQSLITEANNGSQAIDAGYNRMVEQKEVFENIVNVSQNVAVRSQQISNLSKQRELASDQVFSTLKAISAGINQFVSATVLTSDAVDKLNNMSLELQETLAKYQTEDRGNV